MPSPVIQSVPNEIWLRIFALVGEVKELYHVVLVSRRFNALGTELLVRHITWNSTTLAEQNLPFWARNRGKTHLVRSLNIVLPAVGTNSDQFSSIAAFDRIFTQIGRFQRLHHLKLCGGQVPEALYSTLEDLPNVAVLTLEGCSVPTPPVRISHYFSFSPSGAPRPSSVIRVKRLVVSKLKSRELQHAFFPHVIDSVLPFTQRLPYLRSFVTDNLGSQLPPNIAQKLNSLTIIVPGTVSDIQSRIDLLVQRMPNLKELVITFSSASISGTSSSTQGSTIPSLATQPVVSLPHLTIVSAPWPSAIYAMRGAPSTVQHLNINSTILKNVDVLAALELIRDHGVDLKSLAFRIAHWDEEALLAATRCLPHSLRALEVAYYDGKPDEGFIFNLGIHHLPLLPQLEILRLIHLEAINIANSPRLLPVLPNPNTTHHHLLPGHHHHHHFQTNFLFSMQMQALAQPPGNFMQPAVPPPLSDNESEDNVSEDGSDEGKKEGGRGYATAAEISKAEPLREAVCVWSRYNPNLARVRIGRGPANAWVRDLSANAASGAEGKGKRAAPPWTADMDDKEAQAQRWTEMTRLDLIEGEEEDVPAPTIPDNILDLTF
ncbi:F-box domain-containing protein [Mycena indigotica]|uniref:F-box domain-containing protein n=1 Tax=Mycena indigotica TaxID=2126181 RepID=A0A8H6SCA5_9AGAR|nr:F-box domain-containing protein [Mycena indigotica]KAF7296916.1 F-box domain-containing protein [Mycena indigotica]